MKNPLIILLPAAILASCHHTAYKVYIACPVFSDSLELMGTRDEAPYKLFSLNKKYYISSYPYDYVYPTACEHCAGLTNIYADSPKKLLYTIDRYFRVNNVFLSNDGRYLAYVNNFCVGDELDDSCSQALLQFYRNGKPFKEYFAKDLHQAEYFFNWLYFDQTKDKWLARNNKYLVGDTLYTITNKKELLRFSISNGMLIDSTSVTAFLKDTVRINYPPGHIKYYKVADREGLPPTADSTSFYNSLSKSLNADIMPLDSMIPPGYQYYRFWVDVVMDNKGRCMSCNVSTNEFVLVGESIALREQIKKYLRATAFLPGITPYRLSRWKFSDHFYVRKRPQSLAKREAKKYTRQVCEINMLGGNYIPSDLDDCLSQLDKLLSDKTKMDISMGVDVHFSVGLSIRNNWGLWAGNRLVCYFTKNGLFHPDDMSSLIISAYRMHLQHKTFNTDSLLLQASQAEERWFAGRNLSGPSAADMAAH